MSNNTLPPWNNDLINHFKYYNEGLIGKDEFMKIEFIPCHNKFYFKDLLEIKKKLDEMVEHTDFKLNLLNRVEGGFELTNENYIPTEHHELQIRFNKNCIGYPVKEHEEFFPDNHHKSNIKIFSFTGNCGVPRKLMMHLYMILEENRCLIHKSYHFPHEDDIIWRPSSINLWDNKYICSLNTYTLKQNK